MASVEANNTVLGLGLSCAKLATMQRPSMDRINPSSPIREDAQAAALVKLLSGVAVIAGLYFGREVLVPIALAVLLSFILSPPVRLLQGWRVPRTLAVIIVAVIAFIAIFSLSAFMVAQVKELAAELPRYQSTLQQKVQSLRFAAGGGTLQTAFRVLEDLNAELNKPSRNLLSDAPGEPVHVQIMQPRHGALETLGALFTPLVQPLAATGIVVIFVIFILAQTQDLRNRLIRLAGSHDLQRTTAAFNDAGERLSRLLLTQVALNAGFGLVVGAGLWVIGVPSAALWGSLAMILRFVPYRRSYRSGLSTCPCGCGRERLEHGSVDGGPFCNCGDARRAGCRAALIWPQLRTFAGGGHRLGDILDMALGACRLGSGNAGDNLLGRTRAPCRATKISGGDVRR